MTKQTYARWLAVTKKRTITESEIIYFRKMLVANLNRPKMDRSQAESLLIAMQNAKPKRLTPEQTAKGIEWLNRKILKANGEIRSSKSLPFERWDCVRVVAILRNFSHWTFEGLYENYNLLGSMRWHYPIYRMHSKDGKTFTYVPNSQGNIVMSSAA